MFAGRFSCSHLCRRIFHANSLGKRYFSVSRPNQSTKSRYGNILVAGLAASILGGLVYKEGQRSVTKDPPSSCFPLSSSTKLLDLDSPRYCSDNEFSTAVKELTQLLGQDNVFESGLHLEKHVTNDFSPRPPLEHEKPKVVIYVRSTEEVSEAMKIIHKYNVPVIPFGGGTSIEGQFFSTRPGIILNVSKMNKILAVHHDDLDAVVEAGVNWMKLNERLEPYNLMLGPDCGPEGLIGGMVNTNASGVNACKNGAMINNVISLTVVLADGTIIKTKKRPRKTSSGYNLTHLFIGSEGTLGIVTEATVKLHVKPQFERVVVCQFPSIIDSTNMVSQLYQAGIQPNAIELLNKDMMHCINQSGYFSQEWAECPTIFFKIGGLNKTVVDEYVKQVRLIAATNNCTAFIFAKNQQESDELFAARKNALYAVFHYGRTEIDESIRLWSSDVAVPLSQLSPVLAKVQHLIKTSGFNSIIIGHVGDGNFHAGVFYRPHQQDQAHHLLNEITLVGLEHEGTASGEHGIGNGKRKYLEIEVGVPAVDVMRRLKMALDPKRLLNPDKVFKIDPNDGFPY